MKIISGNKFNGKEYELKDGQLVEFSDAGLETGAGGGRIKRVAKTKDAGVYLLLDEMGIIGVGVNEELAKIDYSVKTNAELKNLLDEKGIEYEVNAVKKDLIALLED